MLRKPIFYGFTRSFSSKMYSTSTNDELGVKPKHPYRNVLKRKDVIQHLSENVIFNNHEIAVFNKPAGIGKSRPNNAVKTSVDEFYIDEILEKLPILSDSSQLSIAKFPERYSSGAMIVTKTEVAAQKLAKCKLRGKHHDQDSDTYLVISLGRPVLERNKCKLALKLSKGQSPKQVTPVLEDSWSKQDTKQQKVKLVRIHHKVVTSSTLASLTRVSLSTVKSNALRLYFATKLLSPVLGDFIFSGRVKGVFGVPMLIDPFSAVANSPQKIPNEVLTALGLTPNDTSLVPLFVHLEQVRLPMFSGGKDLILRAPPPDIFQWTCAQLELVDPALETLKLVTQGLRTDGTNLGVQQ